MMQTVKKVRTFRKSDVFVAALLDAFYIFCVASVSLLCKETDNSDPEKIFKDYNLFELHHFFKTEYYLAFLVTIFFLPLFGLLYGKIVAYVTNQLIKGSIVSILTKLISSISLMFLMLYINANGDKEILGDVKNAVALGIVIIGMSIAIDYDILKRLLHASKVDS